MMTPVPTACPIVAPLAPEIVTVNHSLGSTVASDNTVTATYPLVTLAAAQQRELEAESVELGEFYERGSPA